VSLSVTCKAPANATHGVLLAIHLTQTTSPAWVSLVLASSNSAVGGMIGLVGWARFNVLLDTFVGHYGDHGVAAASARIVATVRAHSVCGAE